MRRFRALSVACLVMCWLAGARIPVEAAPGQPCAITGVDDRCELWSGTYDYPPGNRGDYNGQDAPYGIVASASGDAVYLTGWSWNGQDYDIATVAYDGESGAHRWTARFEGPAGAHDKGNDIALSPDGSRLYVAGVVDETWDDACAQQPCGDVLVLAYDSASGAPLWNSRYDGAAGRYDWGEDLAIGPGGDVVYVTGSTTRSGPVLFPGAVEIYLLDYVTAAYDASTGDPLWVVTHDGTRKLHDEATAIAVSPDGSRVFVTGNAAGPDHENGDKDYGTVAYEAGDPARLGELLWARELDGGPQWDIATGLSVSPDGSRVFVTGQLGSPRVSAIYPIQTDYGTVAYDAGTGSQAWLARYAGPGDGYNIAQDIAVSPDGRRVFVTGTSSSQTVGATNDRDAATVAYASSDGQRVWEDGYEYGSAYGQDLVVSPSGARVYVEILSTYHAGTLAYSAQGDRVWTAMYPMSPDTGGLQWPLSQALTMGGERVFTALAQGVYLGFGSKYLVLTYEA